MVQLYYLGTLLTFSDSERLGEGGEAVVYLKTVNGVLLAFKIFRLEDDPYYECDDAEQMKRNRSYAKRRLMNMQTKIADFPAAWSKQVITPIAPLTTEANGGEVRGYGMPALPQTLKLRDFTKLKLRPPGVDNNTIVTIGKSVHQAHVDTHKAGVIIGDDNYFNILVGLSDFVAYMIDADSMSFTKDKRHYECRAFLPGFVDPLICDPNASSPIMQGKHSKETDWFAFSSMLFEIAFRVPLWGGTYEPKDKSKAVDHFARPLHRLPAFHETDMIYPHSAVPIRCVDDDVMQYYHELIYKDKRGEFPRRILDRWRWLKCPQCGLEHSRTRCPDCAHAAPRAAVTEEVRGKARARQLLHTAGTILRAAMQGGKLQCLYHVNGEFRRMTFGYNSKRDSFTKELDSVILQGDLNPEMRFGLQGQMTLIGLGDRLVVLDATGNPLDQISVDRYRQGFPLFDANDENYYWISEGKLWRNDTLAPFYIGNVMPNQTRFWVGPEFGFGYYLAGPIPIAFVFDGKQRGINDTIQLPKISGTIIDSSASFDRTRCWFFVTAQDSGKKVTHCFVIDAKGNLIAHEYATDDDGSWLDDLQGRCAARLPKADGSAVHVLFAASDKGLRRIHETNGRLELSTEFPDTQSFVHAGHELLFGTPGIYTLDRSEIRCVQLT